MLMFGKNQQNSVKQLSFNKKEKKKRIMLKKKKRIPFDISEPIKAGEILADEENKCSQTAFPDSLSIMQTSVNLS